MEVDSTEVELLEIRFGQKGFGCVNQLGEDFGHEVAVPLAIKWKVPWVSEGDGSSNVI